jgi:branched-chain amino acid transport system substrate-binding protein
MQEDAVRRRALLRRGVRVFGCFFGRRKDVKRFRFLIAGLILVCAAEGWAQEPIRVGFLYILSGRGAVFGGIARQGAQLAVEEINAAGGIQGRIIEAFFEDTQGKPDKAIALATRLVKEQQVDALIGLVSSGEAEQVAPLMREFRKPLIITTATTPVVTGQKCNRFTFRVTCTTDQTLKSAALLASRQNVKKWTTVGPDYLLGWESWELFQKFLAGMKPDAAFASKNELAFAPMTTEDWKPIIKKVADSGADGVLISLWGGNAVDFVRQAHAEKFFTPNRTVLMTVAGSMDVVMGLGTEMPIGAWLGTPYWFDANKSERNVSFVDRYEKRFRQPPSYMAETAYAGTMFFAEAARKANTTQGLAVAKALEGMELELPVGKVVMRAADHQALFDIFWGQASSTIRLTAQKKPYRVLEPFLSFSPDQVLQTPEEAGCVMGDKE